MHKKVILIGATGAIGKQLVQLLITDPAIETITLFTRAKVDFHSAKVEAIVLKDLFSIDTYDLAADAIYICLGTTIKKAGSDDAFKRIDFDLVMFIAQWAKAHDIKQCHVISSAGADKSSRFKYLAVKGEMEAGIKAIGFNALYIYQPPLLGKASRADFRLSEFIGWYGLTILAHWFKTCSHLEPISVEDVAITLHKNLYLAPTTAVNIISPNHFQRVGLDLKSYYANEIATGNKLLLLGSSIFMTLIVVMIIFTGDMVYALSTGLLFSGGLSIVGYFIRNKNLAKNEKLAELNENSLKLLINTEKHNVNNAINLMNRLLAIEWILLIISISTLTLSNNAPFIEIALATLFAVSLLLPIDGWIKSQQVNFLRWIKNRT